MGSDVCRRLERVLQQFIIQEKQKRAPSARGSAKSKKARRAATR
jgi:hypothetical protein